MLWPVLACLCGLYASDDLRQWATGIGETPRLALACLLLSWPIFGLLGAGLDSPHLTLGALAGAVSFVQTRVGRGRRFFRLYKFRSMYQGTSVLVQESGAIVKRHDDARVTRVGRVLRRFSLDEAPQQLTCSRVT